MTDNAKPQKTASKAVSLDAWCRRNLTSTDTDQFWVDFTQLLPDTSTTDMAHEIVSRLLSEIYITRKINAVELLQAVKFVSRKRDATYENIAKRIQNIGNQLIKNRSNSNSRAIMKPGSIKTFPTLLTKKWSRKVSKKYNLQCHKCASFTNILFHYNHTSVGAINFCGHCHEIAFQRSFPKGGDAFYGALRAF